MIVVELKDFEIYRDRLLSYAVGLLKTRGSANTLYSEYNDIAKDIVQECYLAFHSSNLGAFVTEAHLFSFLKICLYKKYQESVSKHRRITQYSMLKDSNIDSLDLDNKYGYIDNQLDSSSYVDDFLKTLTVKQGELLIKLIDGFKSIEVAKDTGISRQAISDSLNNIKKKYIEYENPNS